MCNQPKRKHALCVFTELTMASEEKISDGAQFGARTDVVGPLYPDEVKRCDPSPADGNVLRKLPSHCKLG